MKDKLRFLVAWALLTGMGLSPVWAQSAQQEFKNSWSYYQKKLQAGASRAELQGILSKIMVKYRGKGVSLSQVSKELSKWRTGSDRDDDAPVLRKPLMPTRSLDADANEMEDATSPTSSALIGEVTREIESLEMQRRQVSISEKIRSDVEEVLGEYMDRSTYMVAVQVSLERVRRSRSKANEIPTPSEAEEAGIELPGLPTSKHAASSAVARAAEDAIQPWEHLFRLKRLKVTVLLQQNAFKPGDKRFISNVIRMRSGFDEVRGDLLVIQELPFPTLARAIAEMTPKKIEEPKSTVTTPPPAPEPVIPQKVWAWLLGALAVVTLALVWRVGRSSSQAPQPFFAPAGMPGMSMMPPFQVSSHVPPPPPPPAPPAPPPPAASPVSPPRLFEELRHFVNVTVVGNAELSTEVLKGWWGTGETGQANAVTFLRAADPKLLATLGEELGADLATQLQAGLSQRAAPTAEEAEDVFSRFREDYEQVQRTKLLESGANKDRDLFRFLKKLEVAQLAKLFEDEEAGVIAVGLAQVTADIASRVLAELSPEKRMKVPVEMGRLKKIPVSAFHDIAERLSKKALGVADIRFIATDGVESLISMLEQLDAQTERQVLTSLQQQDMRLAEEIRRTYLTAADLENASERFLSEFLRGVDREVLAKFMAGSSEDLRSRWMAYLPDRLKVMVEELASQFADAPPQELEQAKKSLLAEARGMVKSGKFTMKQVLGA